MIERIGEFIENQGISIRSFEQKISASNGLIRKALTNKTDIQSKWLSIIVDNYPQINPEWLLTGRGSMLRSDSNITQQTPEPLSTQQSEVIALLKEQLKDKEAELKELNQEIGVLKHDNRKLLEQVMGLDVSERKSSASTSQSPPKDAPSVIAHL